MYIFSGIVYKILGTFGIIFLIAIALVLFEKPWSKTFNIRKCKFAIFMMILAICGTVFYASRIVSPDVSSYTGKFIESHRTSSSASPLPFNNKYVFWNGEGKKEVFYLDMFSKKKICPSGFEDGKTYTIYYDDWSNIIVGYKG